MNPNLSAFLMPRVTPFFILRMSCVAAAAYFFFGFICTPLVIRGKSMEPAFRDGGFNFIWKPAFWFSPPEPGDVVAVRLAGNKVVYLKRVVAMAGQRVGFRAGVLFVDGQAVEEPYVNGPCRWNLADREVDPGNVYLVGDNRSMPMDEHDFGQTSDRRVQGVPLW
jgi:signal peptidase I